MIGKKREESESGEMEAGEGEIFEAIARKLQSGKSINDVVKKLVDGGVPREATERVVKEIAKELEESEGEEEKSEELQIT